jgi:hypothetical protein
MESFAYGAQQASANIFRVVGGWGNVKYVFSKMLCTGLP